MRRRAVAALVGMIALLAFVATLSIAAGPKSYQWTGTVTDVNEKAKIISVDKAGEIWEFSTEGLKDVKVKKGDKVTVHYQAIAKKIEVKK